MKVGDLVNAAYVRMGIPGIFHSGVIVEIEESTDLFSEKYAITETNTYIKVLVDGKIMTFELEEDKFEVINESR
jgi:hypothetical protein